MKVPTISVYCDGSVTDSVLTDVYESSVGPELVGRAVVVAPEIDLGVIKQTTEGMVTARGTPASEVAEIFAINTALGLCQRERLHDFVVFSDCQGAVRRFPDMPVEWRRRDEMRLPNDFFDKILRRGSYLRRTEGKVYRRRPPQDHQTEIFELFNADHREFRLSDSPLWARVCHDARNHPDALGTSEE